MLKLHTYKQTYTYTTHNSKTPTEKCQLYQNVSTNWVINLSTELYKAKKSLFLILGKLLLSKFIHHQVIEQQEKRQINKQLHNTHNKVKSTDNCQARGTICQPTSIIGSATKRTRIRCRQIYKDNKESVNKRLLQEFSDWHGSPADRSILIIVESGVRFYRSLSCHQHYHRPRRRCDRLASPRLALPPTELLAVRRPRHGRAAPAPWSAGGGPRGRRTRPLTSRRPDRDFIYIVDRTTTLIPQVCGPLRSRIPIRSVRLNTL